MWEQTWISFSALLLLKCEAVKHETLWAQWHLVVCRHYSSCSKLEPRHEHSLTFQLHLIVFISWKIRWQKNVTLDKWQSATITFNSLHHITSSFTKWGPHHRIQLGDFFQQTGCFVWDPLTGHLYNWFYSSFPVNSTPFLMQCRWPKDLNSREIIQSAILVRKMWTKINSWAHVLQCFTFTSLKQNKHKEKHIVRIWTLSDLCTSGLLISGNSF